MLNNKVIVVTGGAGLLGQEFIKCIVKEKGLAIIADINEERGKNIRNKLCDNYQTDRIEFIQLDITSKESLQNCINLVNSKYKRIDALINNAYPRNKNYGRAFFEVKYNDFVENLALNLGGYFTTSQQFAKYFIKQGYGNIINISSIYGVIAPKFEIYEKSEMTMPVEYAAIKAGLIHLTKYMAKYFKGKNIKVNAISPGGIYDQQTEQFVEKYNNNCLSKGMLNKQDINGALLFLLSEMSQFVNGQNIIVDDGFTL